MKPDNPTFVPAISIIVSLELTSGSIAPSGG